MKAEDTTELEDGTRAAPLPPAVTRWGNPAARINHQASLAPPFKVAARRVARLLVEPVVAPVDETPLEEPPNEEAVTTAAEPELDVEPLLLALESHAPIEPPAATELTLAPEFADAVTLSGDLPVLPEPLDMVEFGAVIEPMESVEPGSDEWLDEPLEFAEEIALAAEREAAEALAAQEEPLDITLLAGANEVADQPDAAVGDDLEARLRASIRDIPDFPKPGIVFKDITPVLADATLFEAAIRRLAEDFLGAGIDLVVGIESRGFIFAAPLALALNAGFVPIRKPGKLPFEKVRVDYALEYGQDALEAHRDAIVSGQRIAIVDDVLATGGTAAAATRLVQQLGGHVVAISFLVELSFLHGREKLSGLPVHALVTY